MDDLYKANPAYNTGVRRTREREKEREEGSADVGYGNGCHL